MEIKRSYDRLISTIWIPIPVRWHLYIESGPTTYMWHTINKHCPKCNGGASSQNCTSHLAILKPMFTIGTVMAVVPAPVFVERRHRIPHWCRAGNIRLCENIASWSSLRFYHVWGGILVLSAFTYGSVYRWQHWLYTPGKKYSNLFSTQFFCDLFLYISHWRINCSTVSAWSNWRAVGKARVRRLLGSLHRRIRAIIETEGGHMSH